MNKSMDIKKPASVLVLITGGTFDKSYHPVEETLDFSAGSLVPKLLEMAQVTDAPCEEVMMIDSLYMDDEKRTGLLAAIERHAADRVLVVHGTSTIRDTATYLSSHFSSDKTIVLTGALVPARYDAAEASFNFGLAFAAARYFSHGVYVAMHGLVVHAEEISKSGDTGQFRLYTP